MEEGVSSKIEQALGKQTTRRNFLRGTGKVAKGAALGLLIGGVGLSLSRDTTDNVPNLPPKDKFPDLLTDEQLQAAHICIYQTPNVKLFLRPGVFDLPLFRDTKEGKVGETVIVLVDSPSLSWNTSEKMPPEAKLVFQASTEHPKEYPEEYWQSRVKQEEDDLERWTGYKQNAQERLERLLSGEEEVKKELRAVNYWIEEAEKELAILRDRPRAIVREAEIGPEGTIVRLSPDYNQQFPEHAEKREKLIQKNPELENKIFIFLAVGGRQKPHPSYSYPQPEQFKEWPWIPQLREKGKEEPYHRWQVPFTAGTALRHEIHHYQGIGEEMASEYPTDTKVLESITSAWEKYKTAGDSSGYPFVFVTKEGITVTKQPPKTTSSETV